MPQPLSSRASKFFVVGFLLSLVGLIVLATVLITRGMNDEELQARIEASREAREAGLEDSTTGLDDPGVGGKAVTLDPNSE
ncbi:MAG: hypothetical protein AAFQ43_10185 [Bacteroidota bacterium]